MRKLEKRPPPQKKKKKKKKKNYFDDLYEKKKKKKKKKTDCYVPEKVVIESNYPTAELPKNLNKTN